MRIRKKKISLSQTSKVFQNVIDALIMMPEFCSYNTDNYSILMTDINLDMLPDVVAKIRAITRKYRLQHIPVSPLEGIYNLMILDIDL